MRKLLRSVYLPISLTVLGLGGLYAVSLYYYATFLSLASLFSIALALGIFILVWTSRHYLNNNYLLFIGIAYLFIGGLQMTHTLALGMVGNDGYSQNTADYLWLASRYVESLTFLAALSIGLLIICVYFLIETLSKKSEQETLLSPGRCGKPPGYLPTDRQMSTTTTTTRPDHSRSEIWTPGDRLS